MFGASGVQLTDWIEVVVGFTVALLVGTFVEYAVHRLMHLGKILHKRHALHHKSGTGQGWLGEFRDYFFPTLPIMFVGFLYSTAAGLGFAAGGAFYAFFAAYAHQVQHENPELVFWLKKPVHHLHHAHNMWRHNFGISVDFWDHVFRTYKEVEWAPERRARDYPIAAFFRIHWLQPAAEPETQNQ